MKPADIATRLNAMGLLNIKGRPWTTTNVRDKLHDLQIPFLYERPRRRTASRRGPEPDPANGQAAVNSDGRSAGPGS